MISVTCPHCEGEIIVAEKEVNCKIFRHGVLKNKGKQVNPHAPKAECDRLVAEKRVFGCCKPFELIKKEDKWVAVKCEYK